MTEALKEIWIYWMRTGVKENNKLKGCHARILQSLLLVAVSQAVLQYARGINNEYKEAVSLAFSILPGRDWSVSVIPALSVWR